MQQSRRLPALRAVGAALGACAIAAAGAGGAPAAPQPEVYVALGDSFSAGSGIAPSAPASGIPGDCTRSALNYPKLVAQALRPSEFRDVTCGAAVSADLAGRQFGLSGSAAPQYDALTPDTTLVTLGMGGNDIGLVQLGVSCINPLPEPNGVSCAATQTAGGRDRVGEQIERFAPAYGVMIEEIRRRSPAATIVLVGYPIGIRDGGCPETQPAWAADATYLQGKINQLNDVIRRAAAEHGAGYVDLEPSTQGHDVCAEPGESWMVGALPTSADAIVPLHPNAAGHRNTAQQVLAALDR
ncbi:SGNH/GDSL hydrolase family protein [Nocardia asteroides]|uniref:SGNH/GDSL hydrolase family protein n=1 Tax=Nocardia asteroides TaxID=1824 RepID=UPI001E47A0AC|nr:SGNH/GDSL hydrolase family protein [Nocardia asteroides]UGT61432.1 SGNH/GDSL hydrolase family protein [Nocardia asteroides]